MSLFGNKISRSAPAGEPFVWFAGLGLALSLLMVAGLLGVILFNGFTVFWPKRVSLLTLNAGSEVAGVGLIIAAETATTREKHDAGHTVERLCFLGNKDVYGQAFAYVAESSIVKEEFPENLFAAERVEYGNAFFNPRSLKLGDGTALAATDAGFAAKLDRLIRDGDARRERILHLERDLIGAINRDLPKLEKKADFLEKKVGTAEANRNAAEVRKAIATLKAEYAELSTEAGRLRAEQNSSTLAVTTADGRAAAYPVGNLIRVWKPNAMGFGERLGFLLVRIWNFVSEEPREANTEGGVFPAIFGTFVMTVCMSLMVTPFGVLAAIYLREYAKQGFLVRWVRISVNNLAGVPSIVFGIFGLGFFVYFLGGAIDKIFFSEDLSTGTPTFGTGGLLWAAFTLALMTLPVVIVATEEALAAVPRGIREASLALGASKWQTIKGVVLPAAAPGVLTGVILAMARGAGEVAPLMMVGVVKLAPSLPLDGEFPYLHADRKFMHLGFHIFDIGFQSPDSDAARPMVFATTLLLILVVILLNLGAIMLRNHLRTKYKASAF